MNQIMDKAVYDMYQEEMAFDNFESFFDTLEEDKEIGLRGLSFKISIDSVMLLMFSEEDVYNQRFKDVMAADVFQRSQYEIEMAERKVGNEHRSCSIQLCH